MSENGDLERQSPIRKRSQAGLERKQTLQSFQEEPSNESLEDYIFDGTGRTIPREPLLRRDRTRKEGYQPQPSVIIPENIASPDDYQNRIEEQLQRFIDTSPGQRTSAMQRYGERHEEELMRHTILNGTNGKKPQK